MVPTRILGLDGSETDVEGALAPDTLLFKGNYVVTRPLGQGGFGITYLARDLMLERDVVIKECFPEAMCVRRGEELTVRSEQHAPHFRKCVEMFMREARSIARLAHPNIVEVYAVFEENKTAYMVLDLIEGADLLEILEDENQSLSPEQVYEITTRTLQALSVVHNQNLLHRDISPDNILLDKNGKPTLIDFGSAREFASERKRENTTMLFVKDGYSPFEFYVTGAAHSPASDLYALGGTIYHLIAGEAPPSSQLRHAELQAGNPDPYAELQGRYPQYDATFLSAIDKALSLLTRERIQFAPEWLELITDDEVAAPMPMPTTRRHSPYSLGDLVSETNKHVLQDAPSAQAIAAPQSNPIDPAEQGLVWRDEFNQETEDIFAGETYPDDLAATQEHESDDDDIEHRRRSGPIQFFRRWFTTAPELDEDFDENDVDRLMVKAYLQQKAARKKAKEGIGFSAALYLTIGFVVIVLATLLAVNQERMKEDGSWTVMFSLQEFCRDDTASSLAPVTVDCSNRQEAREIDMEDRDMIMQMHSTDHIR